MSALLHLVLRQRHSRTWLAEVLVLVWNALNFGVAQKTLQGHLASEVLMHL